MDQQELSTLLARLRAELESGQTVSDSLRADLQALDQDIQRTLATPGQADASNDSPLSRRARELEAGFEAEHPVLVSVLRDLVDRLGKMGI
jgi:hypothetical protein